MTGRQTQAEGPRSLRTKETRKHEQTIIREYPSCVYISVFENMHVYIFLFFGFSPCCVKRRAKNTVFTQNNPSTLREPAGLKFFKKTVPLLEFGLVTVNCTADMLS